MAIDESKIVDAVVAMNPQGNEEGIIDAFEVYLTNHYADYYNKISYRFENAVREFDETKLDFLRQLLIMSGHVCGYNTFGGIMRSDAWKSLVAPMCQNKEDQIKGLVAVLNALGWGVWKVSSVNEKKLVIQCKNTYESEGFIKLYGKKKDSGCYLALGVAIAFMNLVYSSGKVSEELNQNDYKGVETKCRCKGDSACEFVVTKQK